MALHQQGRLAEAEDLYRQILTIAPDDFNALHLSGVLALQTGERASGVELIRRAVAVRDTVSAAHGNLALGLLELGRADEALAAADRALALDARNVEAHNTRGNALRTLGKREAALDAYDRVLALAPNHPDAHNNRGAVLRELRRSAEALESLDRALALRPHYPEALSNRARALCDLGRSVEALAAADQAAALRPAFAEGHNSRGLALFHLQRLPEALTAFEAALAQRPDFAEALRNRGGVLHELDRAEEALAAYDQALALEPRDYAALAARGAALRTLNRFDEALAALDAALAIAPEYATAHTNRGAVFQALNRPAEALACHDRALAIDPAYAFAHNNRGVALQALSRADEAIAAFDAAIALRPDYADAHVNRALVLLRQGRFEAGWRAYEWRKRGKAFAAARTFAQPAWTGLEPIDGKTLFLHWEQGLGDTLQFCRYAPWLASRGANVALSVQAPLVRLLKQMEPQVRILGPHEAPAAFDLQCALMSLPLALWSSAGELAAPAYLQAPADLGSAWAQRLGPKTRPRVGVAWSGSTTHVNDLNRSIPLAAFAKGLPPDLEVISLQKELRETDAGAFQTLRIRDLSAHLADYAETAALVDQLDLVITVDTSVAHLAGALGKPVWILLPHVPDFRWGQDRSDCAWYPSARLFRQPALGDWATVMDRVRAGLSSRFG